MGFDLLASLTLVYVFIFAYAPTIDDRVEKLQKAGRPHEIQADALKKFLLRKNVLIWLYCFPFSLLNISIIYVCIPNLIDIIKTSEMNLINFNVGNTLFVFIVLLGVINAVRSITTFIRALHSL
jgi:hypothetical protein